MTKKKYDEATMEKVEEIREINTIIRDYLKDHSTAFDALYIRILQQEINRLEGLHDRLYLDTGERPDTYAEEIKRLEKRIKGPPSKVLLATLKKTRERLNHRYYTQYAVAQIYQHMCGSVAGGNNLADWVHGLSDKSGLKRQTAVTAIANQISASLDPRQEPEPSPPDTYFLQNDHPDKTDQQGRPYYVPVDPETGIPRGGFDKKDLSMTEQAINARRLKYGTSDKTLEDLERDRFNKHRREEYRAEQYIRKKEQQRATAKNNLHRRVQQVNTERDNMRTAKERQEKKNKKKNTTSVTGRIKQVFHKDEYNEPTEQALVVYDE